MFEDYLIAPPTSVTLQPAAAHRRDTLPDGPTAGLQESRAFLHRLATGEIVNTYYRSPLDLDNLTGETWEMRRAYRELMLKEPSIKAALMSKVQAVAALDPQVIPANDDNPADKAAAKWLDWTITNSYGGWPKLIDTIATPGLIDGFSVSEKVFDIAESDIYTNFWTLKKLYSCDTRYIRFDVNVYKEIQKIRLIRTVPVTALDPKDFVVFSHMQLFESPFGISDLRASYRAAKLIESAIKLRAILLENFSGPFLVGKYPSGSQDVRINMEAVLAKARSLGWLCAPVGSEVEVINLATSAPDQFQATIDDLRKEIYTGIRGAYLPFTEASAGVERGDTSVQKSITEIFEWWLATNVCEVINSQIVDDLVIPNYGRVGRPRVQLGGMNLDRALKQLDLISKVSDLTNGDVSKKQLYDLTRVEQARDDDDRLRPPQQQGAPQLPPGPGGAAPQAMPAPRSIGGTNAFQRQPNPQDASAQFADESESHPIRFLGFHGIEDEDLKKHDQTAGWPPAGEHEGEKLAAILHPNIEATAETIATLTKRALRRQIPDAHNNELFNTAEREELVNSLATVMALGGALAMGRLRQHPAETRKFTDSSGTSKASFDLFGKSGDTPFSFVPKPIKPLGSPSIAVQYITSLVPMPGVDAMHMADGYRRRAFTLAVDTEGVILERVKAAVIDELSGGQSASAMVNNLLVSVGLDPKNPQYGDMVARTNAMDAYETEFEDSMSRDPAVQADFPVWCYRGIADGRQGKDHEPHFDKYYHFSARFRDVRGPRVWNCRCIPQPIYKSQWKKLQAAGAVCEDFNGASARMFSDASIAADPLRSRLNTLTIVAADLFDEVRPERLRVLLGQLADDENAFARAAGFPVPASARFHFMPQYEEAKHPRDDHGRWVSKADLSEARHDSAKASEIRARVTNPQERAKLDHILGTDTPLGSSVPLDRAKGKRLAAKARSGSSSPADQRELFDHLPGLDHGDVKDARKEAEAKPGQGTAQSISTAAHVADHVRGMAAGEVSMPEHPVHGFMRDALAASDLPPEQREHFGKTMDSTLKTMPTAALDRVHANLKDAHFHTDVGGVGDGVISSALQSKYVAPRWREKIQNYREFFKKGKIKPGAAFLPKSGIMHLNGGLGANYPVEQVYAHALTHAIDGPNHEISGSPEWQRAWKAEIAGKLSETPKLNRYAQGNESEGFAEFGRLVFGSEHSAAAIEEKYPLCSAVLKARGMWSHPTPEQPLPGGTVDTGAAGGAQTDAQTALAGGAAAATVHPDVMPFTPHQPLQAEIHAVALPELFGTRMPLDSNTAGNHIDGLAPTHRDDGTPTAPTNENVYTVPTKSLHIDPMTFQYKVAGISADGVSNKLSKVTKWDPNLGGVGLVWRDPATGKDMVVNMHHRHELASRLGQGTLNVRYIDAKTPQEARAIGALANIAEGNGKAIDAAKYLRDSGKDITHLKNAGVPISSKMVQDATALTNLGPKSFQAVTQGRLDEDTAVAVAKHLKDPEAQDALFSKIRARETAGNEWTPRQIEVAAKKLATAGKTLTQGGGDLFGDIQGEESTFDQEVDLESFAGRKLAQQITDYSAVGNKDRAGRVADAGNTLNLAENAKRRREAADLAENFDKFSRLKSNTSATVKEYAAKLAAIGQHGSYVKKNAVRDEFYDKLTTAISEDLAGKPAPVDTGAVGAGGVPKSQDAGHEGDGGQQAADSTAGGSSAEGQVDRVGYDKNGRRGGDEGRKLPSVHSWAEAPPSAAEEQPSPKEPQHELLDVRKHVDDAEGDMSKGAAAVYSKVRDHVAKGGKVSAWMDGKETPVTLDGDRLRDEKGLPIGLMPMAMGKIGTKNGIELKADATPAKMTKAEAKAMLDKLPVPDKLPESHGDYFNVDENTPYVDVSKMKATRARPDGIANAAKLMDATRRGLMPKRDPINVLDNGDGTYTVSDGNSTFNNAQQNGWQKMPVKFVTHEEHQKEIEKTAGKEMKKVEPALKEMFNEDHAKLPTKVVTPLDTPEKLYESAAANKPVFDSILNTGGGVDKALGGTAVHAKTDDEYNAAMAKPGPVIIVGGIKGTKRAEEKVNADYGGNWGMLHDAIRGTVAVDTMGDIPGAVKTVTDYMASKGWTMAKRPKDRIANPTDAGYQDVLLNFQSPDGMMSEVQVNTKAMIKAKGAPGHSLYEKMRSIEAAAKSEGRDLTPQELAQYNDLAEKQKGLYKTALHVSLGATHADDLNKHRDDLSTLLEPGRAAGAENEGSKPAGASDAQGAVGEVQRPVSNDERGAADQEPPRSDGTDAGVADTSGVGELPESMQQADQRTGKAKRDEVEAKAKAAPSHFAGEKIRAEHIAGEMGFDPANLSDDQLEQVRQKHNKDNFSTYGSEFFKKNILNTGGNETKAAAAERIKKSMANQENGSALTNLLAAGDKADHLSQIKAIPPGKSATINGHEVRHGEGGIYSMDKPGGGSHVDTADGILRKIGGTKAAAGTKPASKLAPYDLEETKPAATETAQSAPKDDIQQQVDSARVGFSTTVNGVNIQKNHSGQFRLIDQETGERLGTAADGAEAAAKIREHKAPTKAETTERVKKDTKKISEYRIGEHVMDDTQPGEPRVAKVTKSDKTGVRLEPVDGSPGHSVPSGKNEPKLAPAEPSSSTGEKGEQSNPHLALADTLADRIRKGEKITTPEVFAAATKHHGGSHAEGKYGPSDAYDSLEAGFNKAVAGETNPAQGLEGATNDVMKLEDMLDKMPTQTYRSGNKNSFQQFSTPPHYAYAAAWLANLNPQDTVLEPSAGTGSLAVHAKNAGAKLVLNELDPRRADFLKDQFGAENVHVERAEHLSGILPGRGVGNPSAVIMNPPFSQTAGRMGDKKDLQVAADHIGEAMQSLADGGRLVAIVGRGMTPDSPTYRKWFEKMKEKYSLRANVGVDGKEYKKYGTNFGTRMLVFDKNGPHGNAETVTGDAANIPDLMAKLEGVRNDRPESIAGASIEPVRPDLPQSGGVGVSAGGTSNAGAGNGVPQADAADGVPVAGKAERAPRGGGDAGGGGSSEGATAADDGLRKPNEGVQGGTAGTESAPTAPAGDVSDAAGSAKAADSGKRGGSSRRKSLSEPSVSIPELHPAQRLKVSSTPATISPAAAKTAGVDSTPGVLTNKELVGPQDGQSEALYAAYKPTMMHIPGMRPHVTPLVEPAALAAVKPPPATYQPFLSPDVVSGTKRVEVTNADGTKTTRDIGLSQAGLEAIVYAGQANEKFLPAGEGAEPRRRWSMIGDGTGAGKGRESAGIIADNWNQGRRKAVWISANDKLHNDAMRDMADVGLHPDNMVHFDELRKGGFKHTEGVVFMPYSLLRGGPKDVKKASNVDALINWLGKDFDGAIIFDESHNMGNCDDTPGPRGTVKASKQALASLKLERAFPNARGAFVSATGATKLTNLSYLDRLGVWGRGTPFVDKKDFLAKMGKGGISSLEAVAQSLKARGLYMSRSLSYDDVKFDKVSHALTPEDKHTYDQLAVAWQGVLHNIDAAIAHLSGDEPEKAGMEKGRAIGQFWGAQQRFFNQVMTSIQARTVIGQMEKDIAEGRAPIVSFVNTGGANLSRALASQEEGDDLEELDLSPKQILIQFLENSFPIHKLEEVTTTSADGTESSHMVMAMTQKMENGKPVMGADGKPIMEPIVDPVAKEMRDKLLTGVNELNIHKSPLDMVVHHFGHDNVAEVTGRQERLIYKPNSETGQPELTREKRSSNDNEAEVNAFQGGRKKLLAFNGSGGTGASYHADKNAINQKPRVHYQLQMSWRADENVQMAGRSHRTNQVSAPTIKLCEIPEIPGQKRFVATTMRRLAELGALTRGQSKGSGSSSYNRNDNLESTEAQDGLDKFMNAMHHGKIEGLDYQTVMHSMGFKSNDEKAQQQRGRGKGNENIEMRQFLNRLLVLKVDDQQKVFGAMEKFVESSYREAEQNGTLDTGVENFPNAISTKKVNQQSVYRNPELGSEAHLLSTKVTKRNERTTYREAMRNANKPEFFQNHRTGKVWAAYPAAPEQDDRGAFHDRVVLRSPGSSKGNVMRKADLEERYASGSMAGYRAVKDDEAEKLWNKDYAAIPETSEVDEHFVTGDLLGVWDKLPEDRPKIYKLQLDDGTNVVGRHVPAAFLKTTLERLGVAAGQETHDADSTWTKIMGGSSATLGNGWNIKRVRFGADNRIELSPGNSSGIGLYKKELEGDGVDVVNHSYKDRYFLPHGPEGAEVLKRILAHRNELITKVQ